MTTAAARAVRVGVDVLDSSELGRLVERPWFLRFSFAPEELLHAETLGGPRRLEFLAGRFAAKEAVLKVLGLGFLQGVAPREICVEHTPQGAPVVRFHGRAAELAPPSVSVSITHKQTVVAAVAITAPPEPKEPDPMPPPSTGTTAPAPESTATSAPESTTASAPESVRSDPTPETTAFLRVRVGQEEAHYGGDLVDGARVLRLFGDLVTEITIRTDGDEGLLAQYSDVRFAAPVKPGDYIEARARLVRSTRLRRVVELEAHKVLSAHAGAGESAAAVLDAPQLVCSATATTVVPFRRTDPVSGANPVAEEA